jgi:carbonic anhydrase
MVNSRVSTPLLRALTRCTTPQQRFLSSPIFATTPRHSSLFSSSSSAAHNNTTNSNDTPPNSKPNPNSNQSNNSWRVMAEKDITNYLRETHDRVFEHNRCWAEEKRASDPDFFVKLSAGQSPDYLWIGCSDSRIPAEQITGMEPGHAFVHRNIANLVCNTDLNVMSVITYAVEHLKVKHIVVCGHYGCGGVQAAMTAKNLGLLNPWLRNIRDVYRLHEKELDAIEDKEARYNRLVELNVEEQARNVIKTASVQQSYAENRFPVVHGWVFGFKDGLLKDLKIDFEGTLKNIQKIYNLTE